MCLFNALERGCCHFRVFGANQSGEFYLFHFQLCYYILVIGHVTNITKYPLYFHWRL